MDVGGFNSGFSLLDAGASAGVTIGGGGGFVASPAPALLDVASPGVSSVSDAQKIAVLTTFNNVMQALVQAVQAQRSLGREGDGFEQRVLDLLNQQRATYGLGALSYSAQLDAAATSHDVQMMATGTMAHEGIGDGDPASRIRATGFTQAWGENVAVGQTTPEQVVAEWMASPEHRRNILDPTYTKVGNSYGVAASGRPFWAQEFGA
jgi:uncharacterized protein YkwD